MNILFVTSNRLGDAVLSTGLLARLIEEHPEARVTVACGSFAAGLFRAVPTLDRIVVLKKKSWSRHWLEFWRACIGTRWDLVVDLRNSLAARLLFRRRYAAHRKLPGAHKVAELAAVLGYEPPPAPHIWLDEAARAEADKILPPGKILALGPAANWPCKQWPVEKFAELAQRLTAAEGLLPDASVLILADAKERGQLGPLLAAIPDDRRVELVGRELLTVAACLQRSALFVGNDSGLMHMAAAMGVPTLGLFGPGYPEVYGPWGPHAAVVRTPESREELLARLPWPGAHEPNLMQGLTVQRVVEAARNLPARIG